MRRQSVFWQLVAGMPIVLAVAVFACGCGPADSTKPQTSKKARGKPAVVEPAVKDTGPKLALSQKGVTLKWIEKGQLRMTATAREFRGNEVTKTGELIDFAAKLYENGKPATTMTAPRVVADTANRIVIATGGVTLKSLTRSTVVRSQWAKWYEKQQKVVGNGGVTIKSDVWDVEAAAFVADTGLKTLSVRSSAKGL